jgi:arabinose-5-phosphate isomerase
MDDNSYIAQAKQVLKIESAAVLSLVDRIDENFAKAVELIEICKGRVVVTGMGKSGLVGRKISATLASTGTPSIFLHPAEGSHGDLGMVTKGDVVIALSNSGETNEIISILPILKMLDVAIIAMTGNKQSMLALQSTVVLDVSVKEEACPLGIVPTASTTATLAMGDALAVALHTKRGFRKEDFAFFHPGGSLGRRLIFKVKDLMHAADEIPMVRKETLMKQVIVEISSKRLGMTTVVEPDLTLCGIITDGDLRRGFEKWGANYPNLKAEDVMSVNSKTMTENVMAVQALTTMEKHSITSIVIVNDKNIVQGVIHIHDILKAGIS